MLVNDSVVLETEEKEELIDCDKCNGIGYVTKENMFTIVCSKCLGFKKLDLVERLTGKKINIQNKLNGYIKMK